MKVLLVRLEPNIESELQGTLTAEGISTISDDSVKGACQLLSCNRSIDMVVVSTEIDPAALSKLLKSVKQVQKCNRIPVVMVSRKWTRGEIRKCFEDGVRDCLSLPMDSEVLVQRIKLALHSDKLSILVVDDDELIRDLLVTVLELEGFLVKTVESGNEALEFLEKENRVDAVVSDILMPGITGMELLVAIKKKYRLPVILMTGFSGRYSPQEAIASGADGFFSKPFKNFALVSELRRVLIKYKTSSKETADSTSEELTQL